MNELEHESWSPWSQEAEQCLLGSLLLDNDAASRVAGVVDAGSFWLLGHRCIFDSITRLVLANKPADVVTVFAHLRDTGQAIDTGGVDYLNSLAQCVPSAANVRRYAEIVADKAMRRAILGAAGGAREIVYSATTADDALDRVQTMLASVKRPRSDSDPRHVGELMLAGIERWESLAAGDTTPGIPTGIPELDSVMGGGVKPGRVIVLAARTSVGKTSLATQLLLHVAAQGQTVLMLSQEMTAPELTDRIASHLGRVNLDRFGTGRLEDHWSSVVEVAHRVKDLPVFIDEQPALTLLDVRAKAKHMQRRSGGLALIVVDYLQLCSAGVGAEAKHRHHQIEAISRGLKELAKETGACVLLLSQLNRAGEGNEPSCTT